MKIVVQRVKSASVEVKGEVVGSIGEGLLVLIGITHGDTREQVTWLVNKLVHLRVFEDGEGRLNRSLLEINGSLLLVSQFTLYGDCNEGRRPSFVRAAPAALSLPLYEQFVEEAKKTGVPVATGVFGAEMKISLVNHGPVTLILERA